jgi:hypothetical protein
LGWFIDHDPVYPFLTVAQPCGWRLVDEFATGDNRGL